MATYNKWALCQYDHKNLQAFTDAYSQALFDIDALDIKLDQEIRVYELLNRISKSFPTWVKIKQESLRTIETLPSIDDVIKSLYEEAQTEKHDLYRDTTYLATRRNNKVCTHCKRNGHFEKFCWKKHPELIPEHMKGRLRAEKDETPVQHHADF